MFQQIVYFHSWFWHQGRDQHFLGLVILSGLSDSLTISCCVFVVVVCLLLLLLFFGILHFSSVLYFCFNYSFSLRESWPVSAQFSPLTHWAVGGTWQTIQQRFSSSVFCSRPLWAVLAAWADMSTLWCLPPMEMDVWWSWSVSFMIFVNSERESSVFPLSVSFFFFYTRSLNRH